MTDAKLQCELRDKVGSRASRRLRAYGRMVASLQADGENEHVNLHFDEVEFLSARRHHVHLFDLEYDGKTQSAIVNELQWDALGNDLVHVEFKRVVRGQATESEVPLQFVGMAAGVLTHDLNSIHISCIPSLIPDSIKIDVDGLQPGVHIKAADVKVPEGITLLVDPDYDIAVISELKEDVAPTTDEDAADDDDDGPAAVAAPAEPKPEE